MAITKESVLADAMSLTSAEREEIAEALHHSAGFASPEIEDAWQDEIDRRVRDIESGKTELVSWEQARQQIFGAMDGKAD